MVGMLVNFVSFIDLSVFIFIVSEILVLKFSSLMVEVLLAEDNTRRRERGRRGADWSRGAHSLVEIQNKRVVR